MAFMEPFRNYTSLHRVQTEAQSAKKFLEKGLVSAFDFIFLIIQDGIALVFCIILESKILFKSFQLLERDEDYTARDDPVFVHL